MPMSTSNRPHLIVIGGFLGAGKTSALQRFAAYLTEQGIRVALITNDQGSNLVDTALLRSCGYDTREVAGGCFCCRFDALIDAASYLTSDVGPDVLVAEAVGSCTDLAATVTYPMRQLFADRFTLAPLSVLVDPIRARRSFGLDSGDRFSDDVEYIYRKQLEEADIIVMTKADLLPDDAINELGNTLSERYPDARVIAVSSRDGLHLDAWFQQLLYGEQRARGTMDVDYDRYAAGEARLGWLNATLRAVAERPFDGDRVLYELTASVHQALVSAGVTVGHLKASLYPGDAEHGPVASVNLVRNDFVPEVGQRLQRQVSEARVLLNLRAEGAPDELTRLVRASLVSFEDSGVYWTIDDVDAFSPSPPRPTYRVVNDA